MIIVIIIQHNVQQTLNNSINDHATYSSTLSYSIQHLLVITLLTTQHIFNKKLYMHFQILEKENNKYVIPALFPNLKDNDNFLG